MRSSLVWIKSDFGFSEGPEHLNRFYEFIMNFNQLPAGWQTKQCFDFKRFTLFNKIIQEESFFIKVSFAFAPTTERAASSVSVHHKIHFVQSTEEKLQLGQMQDVYRLVGITIQQLY